MLTIYVSPRNQKIITADGQTMTVKGVFVREEGGFVSLQDYKPPDNLSDVEIVFAKRLWLRRFKLPENLKLAILHFLRTYHAKQDISFDCYAFANMVEGLEIHKVPLMLKFWRLTKRPWLIPVGSTVFFCSYGNHFHHAAIFVGSGLFISVYGAGGDLEVATLKNMRRDYKAKSTLLAMPKT